MLYCRKCGGIVKQGAKFCEKCFSRLDESGVSSVVNKYELAAMSRNVNDFSPDSYVSRTNICGESVFGYRITRHIAEIAETDYYVASSASDGTTVDKTIAHTLLPSRESFACLLFANGFSSSAANDALRFCAENTAETMENFISLCKKAEIGCAYEDCRVSYSELMDTYHIFLLMKPVVPLWEHIRGRKITLRDVIGWGAELTEQLGAISRCGQNYASVNDTNIFFDADGHLYIGCPVQDMLADKMYIGAYTTIRNLYVPPADSGFDPIVYAAGMLIFLLLNGMRHPYINYSGGEITREKYLAAEKKRAERLPTQTPRFARNSLGKALLRTFSDVDEHIVTITELNRVLKNSLIYISTEELNTIVLDTL